MRCDDAQPILDAYLDGELDAGNVLAVEGHLSTCVACQARIDAAKALSASIRDASLYQPAPFRLRNQVRRTLRPRLAPWRLLGGLAALLAVLVGLSLLVSRRPDGLARTVVDAHVRSLMAAHLLDVASSDRHTVKPWFLGKLEYAVDVPDFAAEGFPLAGGRLDLIDGHRVAALVYRRRDHPVNVFIWPCENPGSAEGTLEGYHYLHWVQDGRCWWMVSDVNAEDMHTLADLLRH